MNGREQENDRAKRIAKEFNAKDAIFNTSLLDALMLAESDPQKAREALSALMSLAYDQKSIATVYFHRHQIEHVSEFKEKALEIFQRLYEKTKNIEYKQKIDILLVQ